MQKVKEKIGNFVKWIKEQCKDRKTFFIFICVVIIVYFPTWGGILMYKIFRWKWCLAMATTSLFFWAGPFTPFFPICIAITLAVKRLFRSE